MNFVGSYAKDRALIEVSAADDKDGAKFHITWGSSAAEHSEWDMTGTFDPETLTVNYEKAVKKDVVFKEDGSVESAEPILRHPVLFGTQNGVFFFLL